MNESDQLASSEILASILQLLSDSNGDGNKQQQQQQTLLFSTTNNQFQQTDESLILCLEERKHQEELNRMRLLIAEQAKQNQQLESNQKLKLKKFKKVWFCFPLFFSLEIMLLTFFSSIGINQRMHDYIKEKKRQLEAKNQEEIESKKKFESVIESYEEEIGEKKEKRKRYQHQLLLLLQSLILSLSPHSNVKANSRKTIFSNRARKRKKSRDHTKIER